MIVCFYKDSGDEWELLKKEDDSLFIVYDRPAYRYQTGSKRDIPQNDSVVILYSGSRWLGMYFQGSKNVNKTYRAQYTHNFHAFWDRAYTNLTKFVSDPTTESTPVAVDFFEIIDRGERYGPFGELEPLRMPKGSGYFQCD